MIQMRYEPLHEWQSKMRALTGTEKGQTRWRGCLRKVRHASLGKAEAAGRSITKRFDIIQRAYFCHRCGGWHTTNSVDKQTGELPTGIINENN